MGGDFVMGRKVAGNFATSIRIAIIKLMVKAVFKILAFLAFLAYVFLIAMIVFRGDFNDYDGGVNYTLFATIQRYPVSSIDFWINVVGNVLLFVPFGIFVGYFMRKGGLLGFLVTVVLIVGVPVGIEFAQRQIGRVFDIDDILLNASGGFLGYLLQVFFRGSGEE